MLLCLSPASDLTPQAIENLGCVSDIEEVKGFSVALLGVADCLVNEPRSPPGCLVRRLDQCQGGEKCQGGENSVPTAWASFLQQDGERVAKRDAWLSQKTSEGGSGIRTHEPPCDGQRFSRPPRSLPGFGANRASPRCSRDQLRTWIEHYLDAHIVGGIVDTCLPPSGALFSSKAQPHGCSLLQVAPPELALRPHHGDRDALTVLLVGNWERVFATTTATGDGYQSQSSAEERV